MESIGRDISGYVNATKAAEPGAQCAAMCTVHTIPHHTAPYHSIPYQSIPQHTMRETTRTSSKLSWEVGLCPLLLTTCLPTSSVPSEELPRN